MGSGSGVNAVGAGQKVVAGGKPHRQATSAPVQAAWAPPSARALTMVPSSEPCGAGRGRGRRPHQRVPQSAAGGRDSRHAHPAATFAPPAAKSKRLGPARFPPPAGSPARPGRRPPAPKGPRAAGRRALDWAAHRRVLLALGPEAYGVHRAVVAAVALELRAVVVRVQAHPHVAAAARKRALGGAVGRRLDGVGDAVLLGLGQRADVPEADRVAVGGGQVAAVKGQLAWFLGGGGPGGGGGGGRPRGGG
jgi:hypothetical protein